MIWNNLNSFVAFSFCVYYTHDEKGFPPPPSFQTVPYWMILISCKNNENNYIIVILEGCLTMHLPHEIKWNANLMQLGNFIDVFLARHVLGTYSHHQEHQMLSCSVWFSTPSFWMDGGLKSHCIGHVFDAVGAIHHPHRKHDLHSSSQDHPHLKTRCRKSYTPTHHLMLLMMGVCARNVLS